MLKEIIWVGSDQEFGPEALSKVHNILVRMPGAGRNVTRTRAVIEIFLPNITELIDRGYIIDHIDENPANDYPSNLQVMLDGAHKTMHNKKWWDELSEEDYEVTCKNMSEGCENMSPEDKRSKNEALSKAHIKYQEELAPERKAELHLIKCKAQQKYQAGLTPERKAEIYDGHGEKISRSKGGAAIRARIFLKTRISPFTVRDFWMHTGYKSYDSALYALGSWLGKGQVAIIGKIGRISIYHSLISGISQYEEVE